MTYIPFRVADAVDSESVARWTRVTAVNFAAKNNLNVQIDNMMFNQLPKFPEMSCRLRRKKAFGTVRQSRVYAISSAHFGSWNSQNLICFAMLGDKPNLWSRCTTPVGLMARC